MTNKCIDCINLQDLTTPRYRCKLNCVDRTITDSCCWNSKRYPSKFKPKCLAIQMATELIDKTETGALKQWLRDNIEYEDYCIENNLSKAAHTQRACWYSVLERLERGDE